MVNIFWFRRDLRLEDNAGLYHALKEALPVLPIFIFDKSILERLDDPFDRRISFIHNEISRLKEEIEKTGGSLLIRYGRPETIFSELIAEYQVQNVFINHDYEPYARNRDERIRKVLNNNGVNLITHKDQVIFEKDEVLKESGEPYTVFTPYSRKWKSTFLSKPVNSFPSENLTGKFVKTAPFSVPQIDALGFNPAEPEISPRIIDVDLIKNYHNTRDIPSQTGTSRLGIHLRFGTISIRHLVRIAAGMNETYLNELIWREFYMMILWHFPHVEGNSFKPKYERIPWRNNEKEFIAWCIGLTGYPIVDAGMRELNQTGYMHNRVRMITASFLTKHLLVDWRWGEAYFASKLLDFELASNNGGWQWAAGTGCDAAPYFRVFNPSIQSQKFDKESLYIKKWVPEMQTDKYPVPIIEHSFARDRAIRTYKRALSG